MLCHPQQVIADYLEQWEEDLHAERKPWNWVDAANQVAWGKFQSLRRVFVIMGKALEYQQAGKPEVAGAQLVQGMKMLQEVAATGSWEISWHHSCLADTTKAKRHGAKEEEIEMVLGYVKMMKELDAGLLKTTPQIQSRPTWQQDPAEEAVEEADGAQKPGWWKKKKSKKKGDEE